MGGVTHEESFAVHQFCRANTGIRIALGGTLIHNSQSFISDMEAAVKYLPAGNAKYPHNSAPSGSGRHSKLT